MALAPGSKDRLGHLLVVVFLGVIFIPAILLQQERERQARRLFQSLDGRYAALCYDKELGELSVEDRDRHKRYCPAEHFCDHYCNRNELCPGTAASMIASLRSDGWAIIAGGETSSQSGHRTELARDGTPEVVMVTSWGPECGYEAAIFPKPVRVSGGS